MKKNINVIGHLGSSAGNGNTVRLFIEVFQKNGCTVAGLDVSYHTVHEISELPDVKIYKSVEELPFDINIVFVSIQLLPSLWLRRMPELINPRFRNIGVIFWELPVIPSAWIPSLRLFDGIIVCSHYNRHAIETASPEVKTFFAEHPLSALRPEADTDKIRAELNIKPKDFVFFSSFDLRSDHSRKNPYAVVEAFEQAFPNKDDVRLLIKMNGKSANHDESSIEFKIKKKAASDPRIDVLSKILPYEEVLGLYAAADVYVSLHRAEGLGLGPMEAMHFGKLVIATGYSGNLTFMSEHNSMLVPYQLVEPTQTAWQYRRAFAGSGSAWAEPNLQMAVSAMKTAHENPTRGREIAEIGRVDMLRRQNTAWEAPYLGEIFSWLSEHPASPGREKIRWQIALSEFLDPTLFRLNAKAVWAASVQRRGKRFASRSSL